MEKALEKFRGVKTLEERTAQRIYAAFGSCTALYECHTPKELIADFEKDAAEDPSRDLAWWLDIQLGVEDAFGTGSELIAEVKQRLAQITPRQLFHFFAGAKELPAEKTPHLQFMSTNVVDAWLNLKLYERNHLVAVEFKRLPIMATDCAGAEIATRTWDEWDAELLRDTYGDNYEEVLEHAASLV